MEFRESDKSVEFFTINTKLSEILASKDLTVLGLNLILDQENKSYSFKSLNAKLRELA